MLDYHHQFWGKPLDRLLTTLTSGGDNSDMEEDGASNGDVLPGNQFLHFGKPFLVRSDYIRIFDAVRKVHLDSHDERLAVVTGQPGIGALIISCSP